MNRIGGAPSYLPALLVAFPFAGLFLGGFRNQLVWTPFAALLWLFFLDGRTPVSARALKVWAPWLAWLVVSALLSASPLKAAPVILRWASFALFLALAAAAWGERERRLWLAVLWLAAPVLGLAALITGLPHFFATGQGGQMTGFMPPYYNYTAFVEAAALASLGAALLDPGFKPARGRAPAWLGAALLTALILLSRSRGALVASAAGIALAAARGRRVSKKALAAAALAVATAAMLKLQKANVFKRPEIWRAAAAVAVEHPAAGVGPGDFEAGFLRHNFPSHYRLVEYLFTAQYAHSEVFQALAETGFLGLLILGWTLRRSTALSSDAGPSGERTLAAAAAMGTMCLYDNMLQLPALGFLFAGALSMIGPPSSQRLSPPWRRAIAAAGLLLALGAWIPGELAASARSAAADEYDPERRVVLLRRTEAIEPEDVDLKQDVARALLGTAPARPDLALDELAKASAVSPTNAVVLLSRAELLESLGRLDEAEALARRAAELEPDCVEARLMLAAADARRGDVENARRLLAEARRARGAMESEYPALRGRGPVDGYVARVGALDARRVAAVEKMLESRRNARK